MAIRRIKVHGRWRWQARVALRGERTSRLCETKQNAKEVEAELLQRLKAEAAKAEDEGNHPATLRALFEMYVADLDARGKNQDTIGRAAQTGHAVKAIMPGLLALPVSKIGEKEIFAFRAARASAKTKPSTINRDLRTLRAMLKKVRPEFKFPGGAFYPEDETRVRWLRPEEEALIFVGMPSPFREIAKLAALTLMRLSEIRLLRRENVHLEQGIVLLPRAKAGARPVVLSGEAREILGKQLEDHRGEWVFPNPEGRPYSRVHIGRVFRKATKATGLRDFRFHDLRHHGATMALNAGFTAPIVMALGGWKTERMMRRYAAVTDKTLRDAAEAVSGNGGWQPVANRASVLPVP